MEPVDLLDQSIVDAPTCRRTNRGRCSTRHVPVPRTGNRPDAVAGTVLDEPLAEPHHVHGEGLRIRVEVRSPHLIEQMLPIDSRSCAFHEALEKLKLLGCQELPSA
jgi:hypothetical protein